MRVSSQTQSTVDVLTQFASQSFQEDPFPLLRWLRENDPVHRTRTGIYLVSRHADAQRVLQGSASDFPRPQRGAAAASPLQQRHRSANLLSNTLLMRNPPEHTRVRKQLNRDFTMRRVESLRPGIADYCNRLLDELEAPLRDGETLDIHHAMSLPMVVHVLSELLGVPKSDREWLPDLVNDVLAALIGQSEELLTTADANSVIIEDYFRQLVRERRLRPRDDLISVLTQPPADDPDPLTDDEVAALLWGIWAAGFETAAGGVDFGIRAMLHHPDERVWLSGGERAVNAFVGEVLRYDAPVLFSPGARIPIRDIQLEGGTVPAGCDVRPVLAAANHDPAVFANPERFDPSRDTKKILTFGHGIHRCIGAYLARVEMAVSLPLIHRRFPTLCSAGEPEWNCNVFVRTVSTLPVALQQLPNPRTARR